LIISNIVAGNYIFIKRIFKKLIDDFSGCKF
jgi:hypothetical protein